MALKIKEEPTSTGNSNVAYQYIPTTVGIPYPPAILPVGMPTHYSYAAYNPVRVPAPPKLEMPEANLPRAINYYADYGGCGFWRMIWPEFLMNAYNKACMSGLTQMILDLRFYLNNPIFLDTRSLGVAYYAEKDYFIKYRKRFYLAYAFEYCENSYNHNDRKRENYIYEILKILNLDKKQVCIISSKLDSEFKKNKIKYLIDIKEPKISYSEKICEGKYCLYKIK